MNFRSTSITERITEQVKNRLPHIMPKEVSNFAPLVIQSMVTESLEQAVLAKESSQPQSLYEAAAMLTEFELKNILNDKMDKSKSYLAAPEHRECFEGLKNHMILTRLSSLLMSGSSKGDKSQSKSYGNSVQSEEPEIKVADSDMPQNQEEYPSNDDKEPKEKVASKCDWFTKPTQPQEPTNPDWNVGKTPQQGQNQSWLMTLASSAEKLSKTFDELMSTPIDFPAFIMNNLNINNITQETLLGPAFRLLKGLSNDETWYVYLQEIVVRGADNDLYRFKEGYFPRLRINDIKDMLLLVVLNWHTNLSGDDIFDFAIALRMFTISLVIQ
nr:hypothetical protein [Tanacetum cinerariifolium]